MADLKLQPVSWKRMENAVEKVKRRLERAAAALDAAGVRYAVVGGNAVAAWVSRVDEAAVRNTRDVDILLERASLDTARVALEEAGFVYRHVKGIDMFLDGPDAKPRDAVHVLFANEKVRPDAAAPSPGVDEVADDPAFRLVSLEALVRMKLTSYRRKDQVHLLDMISVGLVDQGWVGRVPPVLGERLQELLDDPDG